MPFENGILNALLVGMGNRAAILEKSLTAPQVDKQRVTT